MAVWDKKCALWRFILCSLLIVGTLAYIQGVSADEQDVPSESQCRPYIEKALKDLTGEAHAASTESESKETEQIDAVSEEDTKEEAVDEDSSVEILTEEPVVEGSGEESQEEPSVEVADEPYVDEAIVDVDETEVKSEDSKEDSAEDVQGDEPVASDDGSKEEEDSNESAEQVGDSKDASAEDTKSEDAETNEEDSLETKEVGVDESIESEEKIEDSPEIQEEEIERIKRDIDQEESKEDETETNEDASIEKSEDSKEEADSKEADSKESDESGEKEDASKEDSKEDSSSIEDTKEEADSKEESDKEADTKEVDDSKEIVSKEDDDSKGEVDSKEVADSIEDDGKIEESIEQQDEPIVEEIVEKEEAPEAEAVGSVEQEDEVVPEDEVVQEIEAEEKGESEEMPENDLLMEMDIPENLRPRDHISQLLRLDEESTEAELLMEKSADITLRELKRLYDGAIKPLEILYKYRDLSNRHFGDPEIFSKPLVLFMGPWSGGKSSLINYLTDNEFTEWSLRTGAEPSPAYFNILMHGPEPQVLDGTQLAADWTFSGLQKFGQGLEERLRGLRLPNKLLEKVNIVEIPGILEVRKQVSRVFPFNDACQWFIDRADVIFLVYDPSKLDVGPETEAILDQLKGREPQTRILLNKADQVKPEELMRVQSALIWNISPLMSSAQPPLMYTTSLWSIPYELGAPTRLLQAQERSFLRDLRTAIDRRVENKIASARRFAVRVRNHAKMVDCYLTTYYNHKTIFGNKKVIAEAIIEHPQNYHIYEGLSTLTNISRYDLPDPETYRDFFRLNPLYDFQQLAATCTYFRGCPINRLDVAIAYDLPELVGKYKKMVESATPQGMPKS